MKQSKTKKNTKLGLDLTLKIAGVLFSILYWIFIINSVIYAEKCKSATDLTYELL